MSGPLSGIHVLDVGTYAVGPSAASCLGQLGAEVIRIENPAGEAFMDLQPTMGGMAASYINANMAKKSIYVNLKERQGIRLARSLTRWADILIENRLPGVIERLGLGYEEVAKLNPRIIYVSMPGFGTSGPFANRPALDAHVQAVSGFASIEGSEGGPPELFRVYAHLDHTTAVALVQAALLGLLARQRSGLGQRITVGFFSTAIFLQITRIADFFATGQNPQRLGSVSPIIAPSQSFRCLDGNFINISAPGEESWQRLCRALDLEHLQNEARFRTNHDRLRNRAALAEIIERRTAEAPAWWWLLHLRRHQVPCGPIYEFEDIARDRHFLDQGMVVRVQTPWGKVIRGGHPWRFNETPCRPIEPTHPPGADEEEVLQLIGNYSFSAEG
ncbi:MAG: CaiB/BaiF CoA transferase family protein [Anaerolineae bacterium]